MKEMSKILPLDEKKSFKNLFTITRNFSSAKIINSKA